VMEDARTVSGSTVFDFGSGFELVVLDTVKSEFAAGDFIL